MKILIIDNYDSFTYNLVQQVASVQNSTPDVFKNNEITYDQILENNYDCVIISPGPGRPDILEDFGICGEVLRSYSKPVLGVCLGHQGIGYYSGCEVIHAPEPVHGRLSEIYHDNTGIFKGLPQGFHAVRYHSLVIAEPLPVALKKTAWTKDGIIMGVEHGSKLQWGVQFHPESISTDFGNKIILNFLTLAKQENESAEKTLHSLSFSGHSKREIKLNYPHLEYETISLEKNSDVIFNNLFGSHKYSYWLDSNKIVPDHSRFSIMGGVDDLNGEAVLYRRKDQALSVVSSDAILTFKQDLFEYLDQELNENILGALTQLPFNFNGGFVGYFGYEMKSELNFITSHDSTVPDAAFIRSNHFVVIDHNENQIYVVAIGKDKTEAGALRKWVNETVSKIKNSRPISRPISHGGTERPFFSGSQNHDTYIESIKKCLTAIKNGESYEVCLTNQLSINLELDPLELYLNLRKINPAQYSAYLHFNDFSILSSSPEQFLKLDRNKNVSTMPIKGTIPRHPDPIQDEQNKIELKQNEKYRAENLMIVDLLRNDLGRVCETGSISVPDLMTVETYQTLNHLVSRVTGKLNADSNIIDLIKATFPGGSITGAPKKRTMEIIDTLETTARGPYTGSLGYLSFCGSAELNIIIRTAILQKDKITIGCGGAIIALSDPEEEFEEILLKAFPLIKAIIFTTNGEFSDQDYDIQIFDRPVEENI